MDKIIKVRVITREGFPIGMAATNRIINYCKALGLSNVNVEVYSIHATYKEPTDCKSHGEYKGIPFRYARSCIRANSFIKRRLDDFYDFFKSCFDIISDHETNINFLYVNSFFKELCFVVLSKCVGKKIVRELCEYPYYKECLMSKLTLSLLFPLYNGFIAISENLKILANKYKSHNAKVIKIPILLDINDIKSIIPYKHSKPFIFHGGTLTESKDAIISTIKAFAIANKQLKGSVDFIIAGPPSPDLPVLKKIIEDEGLTENIIFLGKISHDKILEYLSSASLCILNKNITIQNLYGFSTKLSDVLLSETAVITTNIGEACNWLKNEESAFITEPHKPELIANLIVKAFQNNEMRLKVAKNGKKIALDSFDIRKQGSVLADFFNSFRND